MQSRRAALFALLALLGAGGAVAMAAGAAVKPMPRASYSFVKANHFNVTLDTATATRITSEPANVLGSQFPITAIGVTCPGAKVQGRAPFLVLGFPGAKLKVKHGHYGFSRSYTEKNVSRLVAGATTVLKSVKVKLTGTVARAKLITGKVSVKAAGCNLKSSKYRAKFTQTLPG